MSSLRRRVLLVIGGLITAAAFIIGPQAAHAAAPKPGAPICIYLEP